MKSSAEGPILLILAVSAGFSFFGWADDAAIAFMSLFAVGVFLAMRLDRAHDEIAFLQKRLKQLSDVDSDQSYRIGSLEEAERRARRNQTY